MKYSKVFIFLVFLSSCVTPYDISSSEYRESIVVQGMITDQPGPYLVEVSKAIPIDLQGEDAGYISGVTVTIKDDSSHSETLTEKSPGKFYTNSFRGWVGGTYKITVTTSEGSVYQSAPETLNPVGDFDTLRYEFQQNEDTYANRQITSSNGFNVFLNSEVLPEQQGRVWWRWTGTFHIFTYPQLRISLGTGAKGVLVIKPDPPACSGYFIDTRGVLVGPLSGCTCCDCWYTEYNQTPLISDTRFVNNNKITDFEVAFVEVNRRTLYDKYYLEVEQLSVSQTVYDFWKAVKIARGNGSNLFQTPPPRTTGNMEAVTPNAISVLGYFAASSVKKRVITLERDDLPPSYTLMAIDTIPNSCTEVYNNATTTKPLFW